MVLKIRVEDYQKVFVLPPVQGDPNIPKVWIRMYIIDYQIDIEAYADWSDDANTRKANVVKAVKDTLDGLVDSQGLKGEWEYNYTTRVLTRIT